MGRQHHRTRTLPTLEPGITCLETDADERGPLQALVLEQLFGNAQRICWVDSRGTGTTRSLARLAPSRRLLERIDIVRGFTAYQHHQLVEAACERVRDDDVGLLVLPAVDALYRADDLRVREARRLVASLTPQLVALIADTDTPVLLTHCGTDGPAAPLARIVDRTLTCAQTRFGPRFIGNDHETLVYHDAGGFQTTLAYWARLLEQRYDATQAMADVGVLADGTH